MVPGHGSAAQTTASPYSIYLSNIQYSSGSKINVTLQGSQSFLGFLVVAMKEADNSQYGSLSAAGATPSASVQPQCGTGLTHTATFSSKGGTKVELQWQSPVNDTSNVVFYATFVKEYQTLWVKVRSSLVWNGIGTTTSTSTRTQFLPSSTATPVPLPTSITSTTTNRLSTSTSTTRTQLSQSSTSTAVSLPTSTTTTTTNRLPTSTFFNTALVSTSSNVTLQISSAQKFQSQTGRLMLISAGMVVLFY